MNILASRTIRYHRTGKPAVLQLDAIDVPEPGPGEVRLRVEAVGINRVDALQRAGSSPSGRALPACIGVEGVGVVESVGPGVARFSPGQPVDVLPGAGPLPFGTYGEIVIAKADGIVARPAGLSALEAAALWSAYLTAYAPLVEIGKLAPGDTLLVTAASSGVGMAAIALANLLGARPIALTRTGAKRAQLLAAGAAAVVATDEGRLVEEVKALTEGRGARVAFDAVGGPEFGALADAVETDGVIVLYGGLSGAPTMVPLAARVRNLAIVGYALDIGRNAGRKARAVAFIGSHAASGDLKPAISAVHPLAEAAVAHAALERNDHVGKIVLKV